MDSSKSQVDFYINLCAHLVLCDPLGITKSRDLSFDTDLIRIRTEREGLSFLTKTLPSLGRALDESLEVGRLTVPRGFHLDKTGNRPAFMQAYFSLLFDEGGTILEEASADALRHIRQVCFFAYKLRLGYDPSVEESVLQTFKDVDRELEFLEFDESDPVLDLASRITQEIFKDFDPMDILPRHGPGAVATGERLEQKWEFSRKYQTIHRVYPYYDYFVTGMGREILDRLDWYKGLRDEISGTAKVVLVPKDSRGPRLISAEPLEYQWLQQGLGRKIVEHLERSHQTRGSINFTLQGVNQQLALANSISREFATVDLKDASDRVSLLLVRRIFKNSSKLYECLEALRTTATRLPNGDVVPLNKFAPMGSALCFPVEAYCFWVLMVAASVWKTRLPLHKVGHSIYVYGDDIIIPSAWFECCTNVLEQYGLKVNRSKSFVKGFFRESCGIDAFKGVVVTPSRLRSLWTGRSSDGVALASYTSLTNELRKKGYTFASDYLKENIESVYGKLPYGVSSTGFPCWEVPDALQAEILNSQFLQWRWHPRFQRIEFKVSVLQSKKVDSQLDSWPRLLRDLVMPQVSDPSVVVLTRSTKIKRRWGSV